MSENAAPRTAFFTYSHAEFVAQCHTRQGDLDLVAGDLQISLEEARMQWQTLCEAGVQMERLAPSP
jgi:hypothetical protein